MTDILIIGGGTLGVFHAYAALKMGLSVQLCERDARPREASVRNFGQIVPSGMTPKWQRYGRRSLEIYRELQAETDITVRAEGSVYLASDEDEWQLLRELRRINEDNGYRSQLLTAAECLEKYPGLRADYCVGGLFFPEEVTVDARAMIHRVLDFLVTRYPNRFTYRPATNILSLKATEDGVAGADAGAGVYRAKQAVVCSGGEFRQLFPERFAASDLQLVKLQMLRTFPSEAAHVPGNVLTGLSIRRYEAFTDCPSWTRVKATEDPDTFWRRWGIHLLFKHGPDGSFIIGDSHEYAPVTDPHRNGFDQHQAVNDYLLREAAKIFDLPSFHLDRSWLGYYSQCAGGDVFEETVDGCIHIVTGIGGKGMTAGPGFSEARVHRLFSDFTPVTTPLRYGLFVFDMAGTTVDEGNLVYKTLRLAFTRAGFATLTLADVLLHGAGKEKLSACRDILAARYSDCPDSEATATRIHADFRRLLTEQYRSAPVRPYAGSESFLADLRSRGIRVALNTGYDRATAEQLLARMGWREGREFDTLVTASDVAESRPAPDMIHEAMATTGITEASRVVKVGDSAIDVLEGKNAGCGLTVGVTTGAQTAAQLRAAAPDLIVDTLPELLAWA